jgi:hypothetical protein
MQIFDAQTESERRALSINAVNCYNYTAFMVDERDVSAEHLYSNTTVTVQ